MTAADVATKVAPIQFIDLKAQQARIRDKVEARFSAILDHGRYIQGPEVEELEAALCDFTGAADALAVGSGTQALVMALMAMGVSDNDAVFIPAFTYNATANAVMLARAEPVFVDVKPDTFNMDPDDLERAIERVKANGRLTPKAVIPVDLYGLPADVALIEKIAAKHGLQVLADSAQSFGGKLDGKWVGAIAAVTATSFYPSKALGCYGDGGAILMQDASLGDAMRSIRWHGTDNNRQESVRVGINGRLDSMQCAVVLEKLSVFEDELEQRRRVAKIYEERLKDANVSLHQPRDGQTSGYGLFTVVVEERERVMAELKQAGVPSVIYYKQPLHTMGAFKQFAPPTGLPVCERLADQVVSLPMHGYLSDEQAEYVCEEVIKATGRQ